MKMVLCPQNFVPRISEAIKIEGIDNEQALVIDIVPRRNSQPICPECGKRCSVYDKRPQRLFEYLPIWLFKAYFRYAPRRVPELPERVVVVPVVSCIT